MEGEGDEEQWKYPKVNGESRGDKEEAQQKPPEGLDVCLHLSPVVCLCQESPCQKGPQLE